jgi:hypothetical protein
MGERPLSKSINEDERLEECLEELLLRPFSKSIKGDELFLLRPLSKSMKDEEDEGPLSKSIKEDEDFLLLFLLCFL